MAATTKKKPATKTSAAKTTETVAKAADTAKATETKAEETAKKAASAVKAEAKTAEKEATAAKKETKAAAAKADTKKAPAKKPAKKKTDLVQEVFVEFNGNQILTDDIVNRIKESYQNEGHYLSSIKSLRVYVNLEERKAYYVINDKAEERFVEF